MSRFSNWRLPTFDERGMTPWNWMCQYPEGLHVEENSDIGAFSYINARYGVIIESNVQVGSHSAIYSENTEDDTRGLVMIRRGAKVGSHSTILPNVTIGEHAIVGAYSLVKTSIPPWSLAYGVPCKLVRPLKTY